MTSRSAYTLRTPAACIAVLASLALASCGRHDNEAASRTGLQPATSVTANTSLVPSPPRSTNIVNDGERQSVQSSFDIVIERIGEASEKPMNANDAMLVSQLVDSGNLTAKQWVSLLQAVTEADMTGMVQQVKDKAVAATLGDPSSFVDVLRVLMPEESDDRTAAFEPDFALLDLARQRFPSNAVVLRALADIYVAIKCDKDELECRQLLARIDTSGDDAATLIARLVKRRMAGDAEPLVAQWRTQASSNAALATAVSSYFLSVGKSSEARTLLMECCGNMRFAQSKEDVLETLMSTVWPTEDDRRAVTKFAWSALSLDEWAQKRGIVDRLLMPALVNAGMVDEAFACAEARIRTGGYLSFYTLIRRPDGRKRFPQFVRSILDSGCTQQAVLVSLAQACEGSGFDDVGLELARRGLLADGDKGRRADMFGLGLRLARERNDQTAVRELVSVFDGIVAKGGVELWMINNVVSDLQGVGMGDHIERWLDIVCQQCTNKADQAFSMAMSLMNHGMTNLLRELLALAVDKNGVSPEQLGMRFTLHQHLGDKAACADDIALMRQALTNATAIDRFGASLLEMLGSQSPSRDGGMCNEVRDQIVQWVNDTSLPLDVRWAMASQWQDGSESKMFTEIFERLYGEAAGAMREGIRDTLLAVYRSAANTAGFLRIASEIRQQKNMDSSVFEGLIDGYAELGQMTEAILICEEALRDAVDNPDATCGLLQRQAELYIKTGDKDAAVRCIEEALAAMPEERDSYTVERAANLFREAGQPSKGLTVLADAFDKAVAPETASELARMVLLYADETEMAFDVAHMLEKMRSFELRYDTCQMLAKILEETGDRNAAKKYFQQAAELAPSTWEKRSALEELLGLADTADEKIAALDILFTDSDRENKRQVIVQIGEAMMEAGNVQGAVDKLTAFLEQPVWPGESLDSPRQALMEAQLRLGDTNGAWQTAQKLGEGYQFMSAARNLGKMSEAVPRLEQDMRSADHETRDAIAHELVAYYRQQHDTVALETFAGTVRGWAQNAPVEQAGSIASLLDAVGKTDEALALLTKVAANADPDTLRAFSEVAVSMLYEKNRFDEALAWLDRMPRNCETLGLKAQIKAQQGKTDEAVALYCDALAPDDEGNRGDFGSELCELLAQSKNRALADTVVARLLDGNGAKDPAMQQQAAGIFQEQEMFDEAMDHYWQAASLANDDEKAQYLGQYAECCMAAKKFEKAADVYIGMLKDEQLRWKERDDLRTSLAGVYQQSGRESYAFDTYKEAIRDCEEYIRKTPMKETSFSARIRLAELQHLANNDNEAVRVLKTMADEYKSKADAARIATALQRLTGKKIEQ